MKRLALMGMLLLLWATASVADSLYVTDMMEVTLRTGPGIDHKIIAMVKSGHRVEVLEPDPQWSKVRLADGRQGYILSRFLTAQMPSSLALGQLTERHKTLTIQTASLLEDNTRLETQNRQLDETLAVKSANLDRLNRSYETLKSESADWFELKSKYEQTAASLSRETVRASDLEAELSALRRNQNIRWFLSGAGVLIFGWIIGYSLRRQRRRSSFLS